MKNKALYLSIFISVSALIGCSSPSKAQYKVTYSANGGTFNNEQLVIEQTYDEDSLIEYPSIPTKNGYEINKDSNNSVIWKNNSVIWDFSNDTLKEDITLECSWSVINYNISYNLDGGVTNENPISYTIEDNDIILVPASGKDGYSFLNWKDDNGNVIEKINAGSIGDISLTATWAINVYTVTFSANGGYFDNNEDVLTLNVDANSLLTVPNEPTRNGYEINRNSAHQAIWTNSEDVAWNFASSKVTGNITLSCSWRVIHYNIDYDLAGGTLTDNNPNSYIVSDEITLNNPTKDGYTFLGWEDENGNVVAKIEPGTTGNISLTATWNEGNFYTLTLDPNGGTVEQTTYVFQYDHSYAIPSPTREGYTFTGWVSYGFLTNPLTGIWKYDEDITFVAQWRKN